MKSSNTAPMDITFHSAMLLTFTVVGINNTIDFTSEAAYANRLPEKSDTTVRTPHHRHGAQVTPVSLAWGARPRARTSRVSRRAVRAAATATAGALYDSRGRRQQHKTQ